MSDQDTYGHCKGVTREEKLESVNGDRRDVIKCQEALQEAGNGKMLRITFV